MLYKARNEANKFFNDYSSMVSEAKNKAKGLKILTPKQLLQKYQALAQVKADNNSDEIRQIVYSLYQSKQLSQYSYKNEYYICELRK